MVFNNTANRRNGVSTVALAGAVLVGCMSSVSGFMPNAGSSCLLRSPAGRATSISSVAGASAFVPRGKLGARQGLLAKGARKPASELRMMVGIELLQDILAVPLMYALFSMNEYVTHRWYQHNEIGKVELYQTLRKSNTIPKLDGGGHVEHHAETYDDMSLKTDNQVWMDSQPAQRLNCDHWRGTAFTWEVTAMMTAQCIPTVFPAFWLLGWSLPATIALFLPSMALHGLIWNALHPNMHGLDDVPASVGLPSSWMARFRGSPVFEWLRVNHVGHHVASGKVNYNVCCPGMDFVMNTYMTEEEWTPKIRVKQTKEIEGALSASAM